MDTYALRSETQVYKKMSSARGNKKMKLLMGTWMDVLEDHGDWLKIKTFGQVGFVKKSDTSTNDFLKVFFVDVGQGDAILVEAPGKTILVDGGPNENLYNYLTKYKFKWIIASGHKVRIDAIFVSHFDADHFAGITQILNDPNFEIDTVYHNGIARFHDVKAERHPKYDTDLGKTDYIKGQQDRTILKTSFDDLEDCKNLLAEIPAGKKGLMFSFKKFINAALKAKADGRLKKLQRLTSRTDFVKGFEKSKDFSIEVLGPVPTKNSGLYQFDWFEDSSHTRNGHSIVLKLDYKGKTVLLGGDLNTKSEEHLMKHYSVNPFEVDIAKSCHHGASDFSVKFMDKVRPFATVISSGDNENYAHPRADAMGCAGKYSKGERPLILSTELARSITSARKIHYGLINVRTNGDKIVCAQMKEKKSSSDLWDSYEI